MTDRADIAGSPEYVAEEIDSFAESVERFQTGRVAENVFLEHRLRHGVYGQRQDGVHMMRSKLPLGLLSATQLDAMADLTEVYSAGVAHLTTRQDIQVHFIRLEQTPDVMRVLAAARGTFREACGNVVRNVTAPAISGVWPDEPFDVTPYGLALAQFLLRHPDGQSLGRKFKVQIAGTRDPQWNLGAIHDLGATAVLRDGERGFEILVGGGLGAVPQEAQLLTDFLPEEELLPTALALLRVFARLGEKQKRARARMKFLVAGLGIERFRELVAEERATLDHDPTWAHALQFDASDVPLHPPGRAWPAPRDRDEARWLRTNVMRQLQDGYAAVKVRVPTGDLTPAQLRGLADLARAHTGDTVRVGVDQSLVIRFVPLERLPAVHDALRDLALGLPRAGGLGDTVTCPGADTCKLGITSPRALARELQPLLDRMADHPRLEALTVHVSGCPNSCAQHQTADIGLFGAARAVAGITVPHFVLLLGGRAGGQGSGERLGDGFATPVTKIPARRALEAMEALLEAFLAQSGADEAFADWVRRTGRRPLQALLRPYQEVPEDRPELHREFGKEAAPFEVRRGVGECAGEVVDLVDLLLADADQHADGAQAAQEAGRDDEAAARSLSAMKVAARALVVLDGWSDVAEDQVVHAFESRYYAAGRIYEGVGHYLLQAVSEEEVTGDRLRRLVVEAGLFVEEAHSIVGRTRNAWQGAAK